MKQCRDFLKRELKNNEDKLSGQPKQRTKVNNYGRKFYGWVKLPEKGLD